MGCCYTKQVSDYQQVTVKQTMNINNLKQHNNHELDNNEIKHKKNKKKELEKHHTLQSRTMCTISTQIIRKLFCHFIRGSNLQNEYFKMRNIPFTNDIIQIITHYIEDFFEFHSKFKYSQILLSNNNKTATILMEQLRDEQPNYSITDDRMILFGLPIFPRKDFIYSLKLKIDKCSTQTVAISFISDYYHFKLNYLYQTSNDTVKEIMDSDIFKKLPINNGTYTIWCNGKETVTWNHYSAKKKNGKTHKNGTNSSNYLDGNIDFCVQDENAKNFTDGNDTELKFEMFDTINITIDGFENSVFIQNMNKLDKKLKLRIPCCYRSCLCEEDHCDKIDNLKNSDYCYNISSTLNNDDKFIYPTNKDKLDDDVMDDEEHNSQFQIGIILYDGDNQHGQISVLDQSWSYLV